MLDARRALRCTAYSRQHQYQHLLCLLHHSHSHSHPFCDCAAICLSQRPPYLLFPPLMEVIEFEFDEEMNSEVLKAGLHPRIAK